LARLVARGDRVTHSERSNEVSVERRETRSGADIWLVTSAIAGSGLPIDAEWLETAAQIFADRSEVASVSMLKRSAAVALVRGLDSRATLIQATNAALPICFLGGHVAELIGIDTRENRRTCSLTTFQRWTDTATLKGLVHLWHVVDSDVLPDTVRTLPVFREPGVSAFARAEGLPQSAAAQPPISVGIDAAWLLGGESGAQVFAFEMLKELARRPQIAKIVMISESGGVPAGAGRRGENREHDVAAGRQTGLRAARHHSSSISTWNRRRLPALPRGRPLCCRDGA
jgi:hypothetical protein